MSLRQLKSCLQNQMHRTTQLEEMPPDTTPEWAAQKLRDTNAQYAREHEREERKQRRELERQRVERETGARHAANEKSK